MAHYRFLVESKPLPGREAEYHAWYDGRHTQDLLKLPGAWQAQRFTTIGAPDSSDPVFFMIVDYETDDLPALLTEIQTRAQSDIMPSSDALDRSSVKVTILEARAAASRN